jgi:DNA polymerase-3 subunit alpha
VDLATVNRGVLEALINAGAFDSTGAMRKALMTALDTALQVGAEVQRDRQIGQMNMFGGFDKAPVPAARKIGTEEWNESELLAHEKAVLGFYVTKHPLASHTERLRRFATADCAELAGLPDGTEVVLGGMISRVRTAVTKAGRNAGSKMAVLAFEDLTGTVEAVMFSEEFDRYHGSIGPDKIVFLRGRVDRRREEPSLRVSQAITLEDAPAQLAEAVVVTVSATELETGILERLRGICQIHRGDRPLYLHVQSPGHMVTVIRCPAETAVRPGTAFVQAVEELLGPGTVNVCGPRRPVAELQAC